MRRLVALAAVIALATSTSSALAARPVGIRVASFDGTWRVRFFAPNGPDPGRVEQREYDSLAGAKACGPRSAVTIWPRERMVTVVCEL